MKARKNKTRESVGDVSSEARRMLESGKPIHLVMVVDRPLVNTQRKKDLEPILKQYGTIINNDIESMFIYLKIPDFEQACKIETDFNEGKLEGIVLMEVDGMSYVFDYQSKNSYHPSNS